MGPQVINIAVAIAIEKYDREMSSKFWNSLKKIKSKIYWKIYFYI